MSLKRIEHVQLAISDGEEDLAHRFYGRALGMPETPNRKIWQNAVAAGSCQVMCTCI